MEAMAAPPAETPPDRAEQNAQLYRAFEGTDYLMTDAEIEARVTADAAIDDDAAGGRQGAAATASGDRTALLRSIGVPALVLHGGADPLFPIAHAESTVDALPDAKIEIIDGLGHILSDAAADEIAARVAEFVEAPGR